LHFFQIGLRRLLGDRQVWKQKKQKRIFAFHGWIFRLLDGCYRYCVLAYGKGLNISNQRKL
jgi:hypothetical protein